jgi:hypothetical protein
MPINPMALSKNRFIKILRRSPSASRWISGDKVTIQMTVNISGIAAPKPSPNATVAGEVSFE